MVPTHYYVILSAILFGLGVIAFIFKRNIITIFMSIELMLNAVNLAFVPFTPVCYRLDGQAFVLLAIVVAAAERAAVFGLRSDKCTVVMLLVATVVGWLIPICPAGFMAHESGY